MAPSRRGWRRPAARPAGRAAAGRGGAARRARRPARSRRPARRAGGAAPPGAARRRRGRARPRAAGPGGARRADAAPVLDPRSAGHADDRPAPARRRVDGLARELARGRGGPAAGVRAQSVLARARPDRRGPPLRRAQPFAARPRVARARHRHLRALSRRPRARGTRDHRRPRGARRDRAVDRGGPARWCARRPGVRGSARRRLRGDRPARPRPGRLHLAARPPRHGGRPLRLGRGGGGLRGAGAPPVRGALRAADVRRRAEQRGSRAVRQPREPRPARVQPGDDRRRGSSS